MNAVFTIGHSTHTLERFLKLLKLHRITAIGDVRSQPYSRFNPQFNREALKEALMAECISYAFLGQELGARPPDEHCYDGGKVQYNLIARTQSFQMGLARVETGASQYCLALLCAEKEPLDCHRTILVARHLVERGVAVAHILGDGSAEPHAETMQRLARRLGFAENDLFQSREALISKSYEEQGSRIAFKRSDPESHLLEDRP